MSKISTRATIFGACIVVAAGLMASMAGAAAAAIPSSHGECRDTKTVTLSRRHAPPTRPSIVPDGYTLDGDGHTITRHRRPSGRRSTARSSRTKAPRCTSRTSRSTDGGATSKGPKTAAVVNGVAYQGRSAERLPDRCLLRSGRSLTNPTSPVRLLRRLADGLRQCDRQRDPPDRQEPVNGAQNGGPWSTPTARPERCAATRSKIIRRTASRARLSTSCRS